MRIQIFAMVALGGWIASSTAEASVSIDIEVPDNLADSDEPIPVIWIFNHGKHPIEFEAFGDMPLTFLEFKHGNDFVRGAVAMCGNGFEPRRIEPGGFGKFAMWSRLGNGIGKSGTYRVALPYNVIESKKNQLHTEIISDPFDLNYGDVEPDGWTKGSTPGKVVLLGGESEVVDDKGTQTHTPVQLAKSVMGGIEACVAEAQKTVPWIRGSFTLEVYRYPDQDAPVSFIDSSLLGHESLNDCITDVPIPKDYIGKAEIHMAISHPLP